jgi:drug/metabolite transporter (DMT)-like permease
MRKAFLQLHMAVLLAGFTGILGKLITLNEVLLVWYRLLITVATLLLLFYIRSNIQRISKIDLFRILGVGVIAALHWVSFYGSIKNANVSVALVCFSSIGFFTAIVEPLMMKHRIQLSEVLLGLLTIVGILLIFHFDPQFKTGIIIGIVSAFLGCLFPILNRKLLRRIEPETVTFFELLGGLLFLSIVVPLYLAWFPADHVIPTWSDFGWLLVLSWICTVIAFDLSMKALRKISAFTVNLTYNLEPLYGIFLAFVIYREDKMLGRGFYWGLSLIVISVLIQTSIIYRKHRNRVPE